MAESFEAQLREFGDLAIEDTMAVIKQSVQDVLKKAQVTKKRGGNLPVDTGFLRNSLVSSLNGSTTLRGPTSYIAKLARMEPGDVFESGWLAEYALRIEFGFSGTDSKGRRYNQAPAYFLRDALLQWEAIVLRNARALTRTA